MARLTLTFSLLMILLSANGQFKLYEKGHSSYKDGKYTEAITYLSEYLTKSMRDKSIDADVFYIRALSYYKTKDYKNSIPDFEETLLRGHANKGNIYWFLAKSYFELKEFDESLNSYNNAIRELSGNHEAKGKLLYERSLVFSRKGDLLMASQDIQNALALQPQNPEIKQEYEKLKGSFQASRQTSEAAGSPKKQDDKGLKQNTAVTAKNDAALPKKTDEKGASSNESLTTTTKSKGEQEKSPAATESTPGEIKRDNQPIVILNPLAEMYKDEKRYALVIGNSAYPKDIGMLRNPINDATDMAAELKNSHFEVQLITNATYGQIRAALMRFKEKLDGGEPEKTVGLFYYAGHGLQFEDENFLIPIDAAVQFEDDIPRYCFPIQRMVLGNMENSNTRMNIVILDACRNNPFPSLTRSLGDSGLGEMKRAKGSFVAYATAPGSVAADGNGRNGLYTQELLKALKKPGLTIEQVFKEVRMNVLRQSDNRQNTWDSSNIIGEFHFKY
jgi:hypothetical protein